MLFVGSGCAALIYEIVWLQLLEFVIGSTAVSLGVLLATYMGGMCLGGLVLPRYLSLRRHPLLLYAGLELGIGLCGLLALWAIPQAGHVYVATFGRGSTGVLVREVMCAVCLLPPTVLMGATLPLIARWLDTGPQGISWTGFLYAGNTVGAVIGCLLAGFCLLRFYDMETATHVAVAINAGVALVAGLLAAKTPPMPMVGRNKPARPAAKPEVRVVYVCIALSGLCALGGEVVWTRLMALILGGSVYTFSLILAVFLTGLGLGSGTGAALARGGIEPREGLGWCQILLTAAIAWAAFVMTRWLPFWPIDLVLGATPWRNMSVDLGRCLLAILPAALLWGASFPLALAAAAGTGNGDPAKLVGRVYAANTFGAIAGSLGFSLLIVPGIGTRGAQQWMIAIAALSGLIALAPLVWLRKDGATARRRAQILPLAAAGVLVAAGLGWCLPDVPQALFAAGRLSSINQSLKVVFSAEGMNASVAVSEKPDGARAFHINGKVEASTTKNDMQLQRMLGHVSMMVATRPRSVLVVGFGAGVTAGSIATYPEVERLVICEIEPLVPRVVSRYFKEANYDVMHDPRVQIIYDDGRHFIQTTNEKFDVITSDPIHPWVKGSAMLYTTEYLEMAKRHLRPGGVVSQWLPLYETTTDAVKSEIATFLEVFPQGTIWSTGMKESGHDLALMGQVEPFTPIDLDTIQARWQRPEYARVVESLHEVGFATLSDFLATYSGRASDLRPWLQDAQINRDVNLRLQYLAGLSLNQQIGLLIQNQIMGYWKFPDDLFSGSESAIRDLREAMARPADADRSPAARLSRFRYYLVEGANFYNDRGLAQANAGHWAEAVACFREALRMDHSNAAAHGNLGNVYMLEGQYRDAIGEYETALRLKPNDQQVKANLDAARGVR